MQFKANTSIGSSNISKYGGGVASKGATLSILDDGSSGGGSSNNNSGNTNTGTGYNNYMASVEDIDYSNPPAENVSTSSSTSNLGKSDLPDIKKGVNKNQDGITMYTDTGTGNASDTSSGITTINDDNSNSSLDSGSGNSGKTNLPPLSKGTATNAVEVSISDETNVTKSTSVLGNVTPTKGTNKIATELSLSDGTEFASTTSGSNSVKDAIAKGVKKKDENANSESVDINTDLIDARIKKEETDFYNSKHIGSGKSFNYSSQYANLAMALNNGDTWVNNTLDRQNEPTSVSTEDANRAMALANGWILDVPTVDIDATIGATVANGTLSFVKGVANFFEAGSDFMNILGTASLSVPTAIYDIGKGVVTGEFDFSTTKALWEDTKTYVSHNYVNELDDAVGLRQSMDDYSLIKSDSAAAQVLEGVGYIGGVIVLNFLTGGASSLTGGLVAGTAGIGKNTAADWNDGAGIVSGLVSGMVKGAYEGFEMWAGYEINALKVFKGAGIAPQIGNTLTHVALDTVDAASGAALVNPTFDALFTYDENKIGQIMHSVNYDKDGNQINNLKWNEMSIDQKFDAAFKYNGGWRTVGVMAAAGGIMSFVSEIPDNVATTNASNIMKKINHEGITKNTLDEMQSLKGNTLKSLIFQADETGKLGYVVHNLTTEQLGQSFSLLDKPTLKKVMDNLEDSQLKTLLDEEFNMFFTENGSALLEDEVFGRRVDEYRLKNGFSTSDSLSIAPQEESIEHAMHSQYDVFRKGSWSSSSLEADAFSSPMTFSPSVEAYKKQLCETFDLDYSDPQARKIVNVLSNLVEEDKFIDDNVKYVYEHLDVLKKIDPEFHFEFGDSALDDMYNGRIHITSFSPDAGVYHVTHEVAHTAHHLTLDIGDGRFVDAQFTTGDSHAIASARETVMKNATSCDEFLGECEQKYSSTIRNAVSWFDTKREEEAIRVSKLVDSWYDSGDTSAASDFLFSALVLPDEPLPQLRKILADAGISDVRTYELVQNKELVKEIAIKHNSVTSTLTHLSYLNTSYDNNGDSSLVSSMLSDLMQGKQIGNYGYTYGHDAGYWIGKGDTLSFNELVANYFAVAASGRTDALDKFVALTGNELVDDLKRNASLIAEGMKKYAG